MNFKYFSVNDFHVVEKSAGLFLRIIHLLCFMQILEACNINIPGYWSFTSQPILHNVGVVGFYIHRSCDFHPRDDLSATTEDNESLWIEIQQ